MRLYTLLWTLVVLIANSSQAWKIKHMLENAKSFGKLLNSSSFEEPAEDDENLSANTWENNGNSEEDMVLGEDQKETLFNGFARIHPDGLQNMWRSNVVFYHIEDNYFDYSTINDIIRAMEEIELKSCLTFRKKEYYDKNYIKFMATKRDCFPKIHYAGGVQYIYLGNRCYTDDQPLQFLLHILMLKAHKGLRPTNYDISGTSEGTSKERSVAVSALEPPTTPSTTPPTSLPIGSDEKIARSPLVIKEKDKPVFRRTRMDDSDTLKLNLIYNCIRKEKTWTQYFCDKIYYWINLCG